MHFAIRLLLVFTCLGACLPAAGADPPGPGGFREDFSAYPEGSPPAGRWHVLRGDWKIRKGKAAQLAQGEGFVLAAGSGIAGSCRIEVRFRTVAGICGEGILFGMRDERRIGACHVVRVDPEGLYYGSLDASGEFRGDGPVPALVEAQRWNELTIKVSAESGTYSIEFNGNLVADGLPLEHSGSSVGLLSSWGEQEFALCAVSPLEGAPGDKAAEAANPRARRPVDIASAPGGLVLVLDRERPPVRVLRRDLAPAASFGNIRQGDRPIALDAGPSGEVYVLDEESGRIDRYPAEGGPPGGDISRMASDAEPRSIQCSPPLQGPRGLAVLPGGRLVVAETAASRVAILSPAGERAGEVGKPGSGPGEHGRPSDVAVDSRGRIIVADFRECRVQAFKPDEKGGYILDARSPWMAPPGRLAICPGDRVAVLGRFAYYETGGALRLLEPDLMPRGFAGCFAAGNISEEGGLAVIGGSGAGGGGGGEILCFSRKDSRIYWFPGDFTGQLDVRPAIHHEGGTTIVQWRPLVEGPASLARPAFEFRKEGEATWREVAAAEKDGLLSARIEGLDPLVPHEFRFCPHYEFRAVGGADSERGAPSAMSWSKVYRFFGPEPQGQRRYLDLSVICAAYLSFKEISGGGEFSLERAKLGEKLEREIRTACAFYARNTGMRLNVHADIEVIEGRAAQVKGGWLDPSQVRQDLAPILAAKGKKVEDYDSIVGMWAEPGWRADAPDDPGTVGGGGLTSFGYSSWGMGGRMAWLFGHEYHHQVDAFFNRSGHLDYPLNHPDATVQPGRYGQHWDCNAFYLRGWGDEEWFFSRFGKVLWTKDSDGDGLPDRDPALHFDEARLGTDSGRKDTDGDGLSDLAEVTAGTFRGSDPLKPDTDGDGVADGADKLPLNGAFSGTAALGKKTPSVDGRPGEGEWQELGRIREAGAAILGAWDEAGLYFAVKAARPIRAAFELDLANNGWFLEDDNASCEVEVSGSESPPLHAPQGSRAAGSGGAASPAAEVFVPAATLRALKLEKGTRFGLCVRAMWREGEGAAAWDRELFLSEPWELLSLTLN